MNPKLFLENIERGLKRELTPDEIESVAFQVLQDGKDLAEADDHLKALDFFEQALLLARYNSYRKYEFAALYEMGRSLKKLGQSASAQESFNEALQLVEADGDSEKIAALLLELAINFHGSGIYEDAILLYRRVLALENLETSSRIVAHLNLGKIYRKTLDLAAAIHEYQHASRLSRQTADQFGMDASRRELALLHEHRSHPMPKEVIDLVAVHDAVIPEAFQRGDNRLALEETTKLLNAFYRIGNLEAVGTALRDIGTIHSRMGAFADALECCEQAIDLFVAIEHSDGLAQCHQLIGSVYEEQGEYSKALDEAVVGLKLAFDATRPSTTSLCLTTLGLSYRGLGHYHLALVCHQSALETATASGYEEGVAASLHNIGVIWWHLGDFEQALNLYRQSLEKNRQLARPAGEASNLNGIAAVYHLQHDFPNALNYYRQALEIDRQLGRIREVAVRLGNLAALLARGTDDLDSAERVCQEGQEIARRVGDQSSIARCLLTQGEIHTRRSDFSAARESYNAALDYFQQIGELYGSMRCLHNLGSTYYTEGEYSHAVLYYEEAGRMAQTAGDHEAEADNLANQAYCWIRLGDSDRAQTLLVDSISITERLRLLAGTGRRQRIGRFETLVNPYVALIERILWPQEKHALALHYIERLKARTLVELLADHDFASLPGVPIEITDERQALRRRLRELDFEMEANSGRRPVAKVWAERLAVVKQLTSVEERIESSRPGFREMIQVQSAKAEEICSALKDEHEVVIELFLGAIGTLAYVISKNDPIRAVATDGCKTADIVQLANQWTSSYREFLRSNDSGPWLACIDEVLSRLHETLFRSIEKILPKQTKRIIFVPHHAFHVFPLHAMYTVEGDRRKFLIERFEEISYAPSATVLLRTLQRHRPMPEVLVAVENPTEDLRFAEPEVQAVASLFPCVTVLGPRRAIPATKDTLVQAARDAHVVLCTGHSSSGDPNLAYLALSGETMSITEQFGRLDLPVCSIWDYDTCETGLPTIDVSDEWITLASAPLSAGAATVWSSLWVVDDFATSELKQLAYRNLIKKGISRVRALNDAQRAILSADLSALTPSGAKRMRDKHRHPFYWAGFISSGATS